MPDKRRPRPPHLRPYDDTFWVFDNGTISLVGRYEDVIAALSRHGIRCPGREPCQTAS